MKNVTKDISSPLGITAVHEGGKYVPAYRSRSSISGRPEGPVLEIHIPKDRVGVFSNRWRRDIPPLMTRNRVQAHLEESLTEMTQ